METFWRSAIEIESISGGTFGSSPAMLELVKKWDSS